MVEADTSDSTTLYYKVHQNNKTGQKAIVVMNAADQEVSYRFAFWDREGAAAKRYRPFEAPDEVTDGETLTIKANGLQILIEK